MINLQNVHIVHTVQYQKTNKQPNQKMGMLIPFSSVRFFATLCMVAH